MNKENEIIQLQFKTNKNAKLSSTGRRICDATNKKI